MPHDPAALRAAAKAHGQEHLFAFYDTLTPGQQDKLLAQIAALDFGLIERLVSEFVKGQVGHAAPLGRLEPPPVITLPGSPAEVEVGRRARATGEAALRAGRVGCFLVAGGLGTRLGLDGPKGAFRIGPVTERTLFQLHAEKIMALRRRYQAGVPWLIMTSDANDQSTREFLAGQDYFGLGEATVRIFKQDNMPAVSRQGRVLLAQKDELALSPNGHGGSIKALHDSGSLQWLRAHQVDTLFYFQVDNVLTRIGDPEFIGHHLLAQAQMSSKVCRKRNWQEKVGLLVLRDSRLTVIEYSDLPDQVAQERDAEGQLKWWAGSIAIHVLDTGFIEQLNRGGFQLPYHKAEKAVPCIGPDGQPVRLAAGEKNAIKFETFIFDALTQTERSVTQETAREEDFSPVKNASGEDSPQTAQRDLTALYARWLEAAGARVPRQPGGAPDCVLEISPLTSLEGEGLQGLAPRQIPPGAKLIVK